MAFDWVCLKLGVARGEVEVPRGARDEGLTRFSWGQMCQLGPIDSSKETPKYSGLNDGSLPLSSINPEASG